MDLYHDDVSFEDSFDASFQGSFHDTVSHILAIKSCIKLRGYEIGKRIHLQIGNMIPIEDRNYVEFQNTLIAFNGHFGEVETVWSIYRLIPRNKMNYGTTNVMMRILSGHNGPKCALEIYEQHSSLHNDESHMLAIKACTQMIQYGDWEGRERGRQIHNSLKQKKLSRYTLTELITFYGHCNDVDAAMNMFGSIPKNKVSAASISAMMKALMDNGEYTGSLSLYYQYQPLCDDVMTLLALKSCIRSNQENEGKDIIRDIGTDIGDNEHAKTSNDSMSLNLRNTVMDFHGTFNDLDAMRETFVKGARDGGSLNVMMKWMNVNGAFDAALDLFSECESLQDATSMIYALEGCIQSDVEQRGLGIIARCGSVEFEDVHLKSKLIDFYGHFGDIPSALNMFHSVSAETRNSVILNAMMTILVKHKMNNDALNLYEHHPSLHDDVSHMMAINVCTNSDEEEKGRRFISFLSNDCKSVALRCAMIEFYGHFGDIEAAEKTLNDVHSESLDILEVEMMLSVYDKHKMNGECIQLFQRIQSEYGLVPTVKCYCLVFRASVDDFGFGQKLHCELKNGNHHDILSELSVQIALITMYGKTGRIEICEEIFNEIQTVHHDLYESNITVWNAMINEYGRNGAIDKVLKCYLDIQRLEKNGKLSTNRHTFVTLLNALGHSGRVSEAMAIWNDDIGDEDVQYDLYVVTSLVDGLARSGLLNEARNLILQFERTRGGTKDDAMWMCLLNGCVQHSDVMLHVGPDFC